MREGRKGEDNRKRGRREIGRGKREKWRGERRVGGGVKVREEGGGGRPCIREILSVLGLKHFLLSFFYIFSLILLILMHLVYFLLLSFCFVLFF